mgnify:CR=1 FL=1
MKEEFEYDTDFTERVIITPPTGENRAFYYVITTLALAIFTLEETNSLKSLFPLPIRL